MTTVSVNPTGKTFSAKAIAKDDYALGHVPTANDDNTAGFAVGSEVAYSGQVYVAANVSTGAAVWNAATQGAAGVSGFLTFGAVTGTTQAMAVNHAYYCTNAALTTLTLPATAAEGDEILVMGSAANVAFFKVAQNANQKITQEDIVTATGTGGSVSSTVVGETIHLKCVVANNEWIVTNEIGELSFVTA